MDVIFISTHSLPSDIVRLVTNSKWTHVGILMDDLVYEAIIPYVSATPLSFYQENAHEIVSVELPDYEGAKQRAKSLLGKYYGLIDCVAGGVHELFDKEIVVDYHQNYYNCSEYVVSVLRAGGFYLFPKSFTNCITPRILYRELTGKDI